MPNYYPVIITEQEWFAARAAMAARRNKAGRPGKTTLNVFSGLLHDARDGDRSWIEALRDTRMVDGLSRALGDLFG